MNLDLTCRTQLMLGLYEREIYSQTERLLQGAKSAIDVGAAEGFYSLWFARTPDIETVVSIEPDDSNFLKLLSNFNLNQLQAGKHHTTIREWIGKHNCSGSTTLDSVSKFLPTPTFVKLDIDGGELLALEGAHSLLATGLSRWVIETHSPELERDCVELLRSYGYRTRIIRNARYRKLIPEQRPIPHNRWLVGEIDHLPLLVSA